MRLLLRHVKSPYQHLFSFEMDAVEHLIKALVVPCFQIMDLSLLVKQEMTMKTNPISHVISASYIHYNTHSEVRHPPLRKRLCGIHLNSLFGTFCPAVKEGSRFT